MFDEGEEILIVKLMAGAAHDISIAEFERVFSEHLTGVGIPGNALVGRRTARYGGTGSRSKEPDGSYKPRATRPGLNDAPSFVIECGVSQSMNNLRNDAHFWLTRSNGRTRLVLLISIDVTRQIVKMERWENRANTRPIRASSALRATRPTCIQRLTINNTRSQVTGAPLILPASLIFDVLPPNLPPGEFSISRPRLLLYGQEYFQSIQ
jgi:hypothetical protein